LSGAYTIKSEGAALRAYLGDPELLGMCSECSHATGRNGKVVVEVTRRAAVQQEAEAIRVGNLPLLIKVFVIKNGSGCELNFANTLLTRHAHCSSILNTFGTDITVVIAARGKPLLEVCPYPALKRVLLAHVAICDPLNLQIELSC
jgi:hypothetical protein